MDQLAQATRLLTDTRYAVPIQVGVLIRQLLKSDSIALAVVDTKHSQEPDLIWYDGEPAHPSRMEMPHHQRPHNTSTPCPLTDLFGLLHIESKRSGLNQQTRFIHAAAPECRTPTLSECYAAVYWQVSQEDYDWCYLWTRRNRPWMTHHEQHRFHQVRPLAALFLAQHADELPCAAPADIFANRPDGACGTLNTMERKVLDLLQEGQTEAEVARQLHRSPHSIHAHVKTLYRKLLHPHPHLLNILGHPTMHVD